MDETSERMHCQASLQTTGSARKEEEAKVAAMRPHARDEGVGKHVERAVERRARMERWTQIHGDAS